MWLFLTILAFAAVHMSYGDTSCPYSVQKKLAKCTLALQGFLYSTSSETKQERCGEAKAGLDCIRDNIVKCKDMEKYPQFQGMLKSFSKVEAELGAICNNVIPEREPVLVTESSNVISTCSKKNKKQLRRCSQKLQRYAAESPVPCWGVRKSMYCMRTLLKKCRSSMKRLTMLKMEKMRNDLMNICVETNEVDNEDMNEVVTNPPEDISSNLSSPSQCPPDASTRIAECGASMRSVDPSQGKSKMCRNLKELVSCVEDVLTQCEGEPRMQEQAAGIAQTRQFVQTHCAVGVLMPNDSPYTCRYRDPQEQLLGCNRLLNEFSDDSLVLKERCRRTYLGMDCMEELIHNCNENEHIQRFMSKVNMEQVRQALKPVCDE